MIDLYVTTFAVGACGMIAMALTGGGRGHAAHGGAHSGGHAGHAGHARAAHTHARAGGMRGTAVAIATAALSPLTIFTVALGFGATGIIARSLGGRAWLLPIIALIVGVLLYALIVRPIWDLLFRFASNPALTLESAVGDEVTAVTAFDRDGNGIVRLPLDGQVVDLLATLSGTVAGHRVARGDVLVVTDVDPRRNRCTVAPPA